MTRKQKIARCPRCGSQLARVPLRCVHDGCGGQLVSRSAWNKLTPHEQGFVYYAQARWPTSALRTLKNPYPPGSAAHAEFCRGEQHGAQVAQDGEE